MTSTEVAGPSPAVQTFTTALEARDIEALMESLAPEPVLHSAVSGPPFHGRELLRDVYASLFDTFEDLRVTDELHHGSTHVFFWEGHIGGRYVAGADRLRTDGEGRIQEITIVGRPMTGLAMFITGIGYHLARRRRGRLVARFLRIGTAPLAPMFALLDRMATWFVRK